MSVFIPRYWSRPKPIPTRHRNLMGFQYWLTGQIQKPYQSVMPSIGITRWRNRISSAESRVARYAQATGNSLSSSTQEKWSCFFSPKMSAKKNNLVGKQPKWAERLQKPLARQRNGPSLNHFHPSSVRRHHRPLLLNPSR